MALIQTIYRFTSELLYPDCPQLYHRSFKRVKTGWRQGLLQRQQKENATMRWMINTEMSNTKQQLYQLAALTIRHWLFHSMTHAKFFLLLPLRLFQLVYCTIHPNSTYFLNTSDNWFNPNAPYIANRYMNHCSKLFEEIVCCHNIDLFRETYLHYHAFPEKYHSKYSETSHDEE